MTSPLFDSVIAAFDTAGWAHAPVDGRENEVLRAAFDAHHTRVELHVQVFDPIRAVSVVAQSPLATDNPARRERVAELAMRSNEGLTVGAFEMRWDPGVLMFRITNLFADEAGNADVIAGMVHSTVAEMDRIAPALATLHRAEGAELAALDILQLLDRDDWIPPVNAD